ncbi:MAG TPA: hypothetical protein VNP98_05175 [Chthoniobacterales bacterium]|nr:hypothetical protein [Chthoniobacterales bacterium]
MNILNLTSKLTSRLRALAAGIMPAVVTLAAGALLLPGMASAQISSSGNDFIVGFLRQITTPTVELHLTSSVSMNVQVEYPVGTNLGPPVALTPGGVTIVPIPNTAANGWTNGVPQANAVRASSVNSAQRFTCYMINRAQATSDAGLALPLDTLGNFYRVITATPTISGFGSEFVVVATQNGTTVTITPSQNLASGQPAGVPFNVTLNRGQGWFAFGTTSGAAGDLTASTVQSTLPVSVTNGVGCQNIDAGACDHVFEVAQPVQTWGTGIPAANLPGFAGNGVRYRIMAADNNTTVLQDGAPIGVLNAGQFLTTPRLTGSHFFDGQEAGNPKAIFVVQFMPGGASGICASGDPSIGNIIPAAQYLAAYTFSTVGGAQFACNFVTIIARNADVGTLTLDGAQVPAGSFTAIGTSGYSSALVPVSSGSHRTASANPHGLTVEGYNDFDSYLYPGGAALNPINVPHEIFPEEQCCGEKPHFDDPAYMAVFTGRVAVSTYFGPASTDFVLEVVDLKDQASAPLGSNYAPPIYRGPASSPWTRGRLGEIFGVALDELGNIYVTATTAYNGDFFPAGATRGEIYKINGATGAITTFNALPQHLPVGTGAGLGNIAFDCTHQNFYVSNIDDGRIYRLDLNGNILSLWDHGLNLPSAIPPSAAIPDNPTNAFTALGRRIWGLRAHGERLYYAVWWEDQGRVDPAHSNEIWSIALAPNGAFVAGTQRLEISMPTVLATSWSQPVADIGFGPTGTMLLTERGMQADTTPLASNGRAVECTLSEGAWTCNVTKFKTGNPFTFNTAAGGGDYDFSAGGRVWVTASNLRNSFPASFIDGLQGLPASGGTTSNSILIDLNSNTSVSNATEIGDVEIPCPDCEINGTVVTPSTVGSPYTYQFTITNHSNQPASSVVILPVSGVTTITPQTFQISPPLAPGQTSQVLTITLGGAQPGGQACFNIALVTADGSNCCSRQVCVPIPSCFEVLDQRIESLPNNMARVTVTLRSLESYTLYYAAISVGNGKTATPDFFTLSPPVPPLGTTTISTIISPVAPGETIFYTLSVHYDYLEICCSRELSFTASGTPPPGGTPTPTPSVPPGGTPTPTPGGGRPPGPLNLSTRLRVQPGDNVGIGGFIITGAAPKHAIIRAIGPSLTQLGVPNALADPVLELHGPGAFATITNDNWREDPVQEAAILATGLAPADNLESAIDATLNPGAYTAVMRGTNNTSGVALIEVYDLSQAVAPAELANLSTRAFVSTGDDIVIAGFVLGGGNGDGRVALRGMGPSLNAVGVTNALADPTLELRDGNGALLIANNDWQDDPTQASELMFAGLAPTNALESGIVATLPPGTYTALLAGNNNGTGVGLVEFYDLNATGAPNPGGNP